MISEDLLEILRCPSCVRDKEGLLSLVKDTWLVCQEPDCGRKYPIKVHPGDAYRRGGQVDRCGS